MSQPGFFVRHRVGLRWTFGLLALASFVGAGVLIGFGVANLVRLTDLEQEFLDKPRVGVPGETTVELPAGLQTVWIELDGLPTGPETSLTQISVRNETTDAELPFTPYDETQRKYFETDNTHGNSVGSVLVPASGRFIVYTEGSTDRTLVIGNSDITATDRYSTTAAVLIVGAVALGVLFLVFLIFMVLMLVLARKPRANTTGIAPGWEAAVPPPSMSAPSVPPPMDSAPPMPTPPAPASPAVGAFGTPSDQTTT